MRMKSKQVNTATYRIHCSREREYMYTGSDVIYELSPRQIGVYGVI